MKWLNNITKKDGIIAKITNVVDKSVTDKDAKNEIIYQISMILMQSKIAPYVRALISIIAVVGCMFFADKLTIDTETQKYLLMSVYGFYLLDFMRSNLGK